MLATEGDRLVAFSLAPESEAEIGAPLGNDGAIPDDGLWHRDPETTIYHRVTETTRLLWAPDMGGTWMFPRGGFGGNQPGTAVPKPADDIAEAIMDGRIV